MIDYRCQGAKLLPKMVKVMRRHEKQAGAGMLPGIGGACSVVGGARVGSPSPLALAEGIRLSCGVGPVLCRVCKHAAFWRYPDGTAQPKFA